MADNNKSPLSLHVESEPKYNQGRRTEVTREHREFPTKKTNWILTSFKCDQCGNFAITEFSNFCQICGCEVEFMFNNPSQFRLEKNTPPVDE